MTELNALLEVLELVDLKLKLEGEAEEFHLKKWGKSQNLQGFAINAMYGCEAIGKQKALLWCRMMLQQQIIKLSGDENDDKDEQ